MADLVSPWIDVALPDAPTIDHLQLSIVADRLHSVPTQVTLVADGTPVRTLPLPTVTRGARDGTVKTLDIRFDPVRAANIKLEFNVAKAAQAKTTPGQEPLALPISIADATLAGVPVPASPATIDTGCRTDLVTVDGAAVPGGDPRAPAPRPAPVSRSSACTDALPLTQGSHRVVTGEGLASAWNVDRLVLSSDDAGRPAPVTPAGAPITESGARVRITGSTADSYHLPRPHRRHSVLAGARTEPQRRVGGDGRRSFARFAATGERVRQRVDRAPRHGGHDRHRAAVDPAALGVDRVDRVGRRGTRVSAAGVRPSPTRRVGGRPRSARPTERSVARDVRRRGTVDRHGAGCGRHRRRGDRVRLAVVDRRARRARRRRCHRWLARGRLILAAGAPLALALGALFDVPELGWVAIGLLLGDLVAGWWWTRESAVGSAVAGIWLV